MKRLITIFLSIFSVLLLSAQIQYGYVKTKGRLGADGNVIPGVRLSGATVSIKDRSALISASDGAFSFPLPGKSYIVKNVRKNGYLLTDAEQLRSYGYSSNPLILVMETPEQQNEDRLMAEIKINRTLRSTIRQREEELDSLRAANRITKEEYHKLNAQLNTDEERNRKLIDEMVERYAKMDFDQMDERNREIKACILNGELLKADSLINSKGDLDARIREYIRLREANAREAEELKKRSETLASSRTIEEKTLLELAEDCFNKSDMFKMGHQNDSAAYYLVIRSELDTMNVQWQLEAGRFLDKYLAAYNKALDYYNRGLRNALMKSGEKSSDVIKCYNNIGCIYSIQGDYAQALEYHNKTLTTCLLVFGECHPDVATCYNNIGIIYFSQDDYVKALEYFNKALSILLSVYGENHPYVSTSYNNIGLIYKSQGVYVKALEYYNKALSILLSVYGENHPDVAISYNNIGLIYKSQGVYVKALKYYNKALSILLSAYGNRHPVVATNYNNIGDIYRAQGDYANALGYHNKALSIRLTVFGENHPDVANSYTNIGGIYSSQGVYVKALEYHNKALSILLSVFGENHSYVATSYNNIGFIYFSQGDYANALGYYNKALFIRLTVFGENHPDVANSYTNIGGIYSSQGVYVKALEYHNKALSILLSVFGENHPTVATSYNNIGSIYFCQRDYFKALEYINDALSIRLSVFGENHSNIATCYSNIGLIYFFQGDYIQALEYFKKSLNIYTSLYDHNNINFASCSKTIYETYCKLLQQSDEKKKEFEDFMSQYSFTISLYDGKTSDPVQGMSRPYDLLEFDDWNIYSLENLFEKSGFQGYPKDIVVMKNGVITKHHFEDKIGCQIGIKYVGKEEKQRIVESYNKWKKE